MNNSKLSKKIMSPELARYAAMLRLRRLELGLTQEKVALDVGIAYQQYQNFEYGYRNIKNANFGLGLRICAVLELDPYELIFANNQDWVKGQEWLK